MGNHCRRVVCREYDAFAERYQSLRRVLHIVSPSLITAPLNEPAKNGISAHISHWATIPPS
jgi:hypothetical protein